MTATGPRGTFARISKRHPVFPEDTAQHWDLCFCPQSMARMVDTISFRPGITGQGMTYRTIHRSPASVLHENCICHVYLCEENKTEKCGAYSRWWHFINMKTKISCSNITEDDTIRCICVIHNIITFWCLLNSPCI